MVHGRGRLYGRRAAEYRLDVRRPAAATAATGGRLTAGRQGRAGGNGRVAGRGAGDARGAVAASAAVDGRRHFVVVVDGGTVVAASTATAGRFSRRFGTVVAARVAAGRVAVSGRRRFVRAVVMLLLVLFHLLSALGPSVLEPHLRHTTR